MLRISRRGRVRRHEGWHLPFCHWDKHIRWSASSVKKKRTKKEENELNHKGTQLSLMCKHRQTGEKLVQLELPKSQIKMYVLPPGRPGW